MHGLVPLQPGILIDPLLHLLVQWLVEVLFRRGIGIVDELLVHAVIRQEEEAAVLRRLGNLVRDALPLCGILAIHAGEIDDGDRGEGLLGLGALEDLALVAVKAIVVEVDVLGLSFCRGGAGCLELRGRHVG